VVEAIADATPLGGAHTGDLISQRTPEGACPRCDAPLTRARIGGRTSWWCPACQI
jgi:formamidopyrimidine-DNA glycosylase